MRTARQNLVCSFDAIDPQHFDIHQDDIWLQLLRLADRFFSCRRFAYHLGIWDRVQQPMHAITKQGMIIDNENTDRVHTLLLPLVDGG